MPQRFPRPVRTKPAITLVFALALGLTTSMAHADLAVGNYQSGNSAVVRFAGGAGGDVAPLTRLATNRDGVVLQSPLGLAYAADEDALYVADMLSQAVRVYPAAASGNVLPLRSLTASTLGQVQSLAVDGQHGELFLISNGCCLTAFDRNASGDAPYLRRVQSAAVAGSVTRLRSPSSLAYLPGSDEIAVLNYNPDPIAGSTNLLVFARTADGNSAPLRAIEGATTALGNAGGFVAHDAVNGELWVASQSTGPSGASWSLLAFADSASGNVAPLRRIAGLDTGLTNLGGLAVDPARGELLVTSNSGSGHVLVFDRTADGNAAPLRQLRGQNTGFNATYGLAVLPDDRLFAHGFQP